MSKSRPNIRIKQMHFSRFDLHDHAWCAEFEDGEWDEVDSLTLRSMLATPNSGLTKEHQQ